jgi:tetraacyldisaccharide 4'-kinase
MAKKHRKYGLFLYPLSLIYGLVVSFRHLLFNIRILPSKEFQIPVIGVGNITVGGTGKTPHIEYLANLLKHEFHTATLSRGYKRKSKGYKVVTTLSSTIEVGDEPLQIQLNNPEVTVAVCESRVKGIELLLKEKTKPIQVVLLDDAYQHLYVKPGMSILLIDYNRPLWEDYLLPYGDLRERQQNKNRANIIIVTKMPPEIKPIERRILEKDLNLFPYQTLYFTTIKYKNPVILFEGKTIASQYSFLKNKYHVVLVTGIACADELIKHIKRFSLSVTHLSFTDHYYYKEKDIQKIFDTFAGLPNDKILITTEKDALRLRESKGIQMLELLPVFYIPIEIDFLYGDKNRFNNQIIDYVRKNKPVSSIYPGKNRF